MATPVQYTAAAAAMAKLAHSMIASLPFFEQGPAQAALNSDLLHKFAVAAVDAALAEEPKT
jgi:hypothetical protein